MRVIIAGTRTLWVSPEFIREILHKHGIKKMSEVVCGGANGMDAAGKNFAQKNNIPVEMFEVTRDDWNKHGRAAGPMRNKRMANYGDTLLLVWDGKSRGSANMKQEMLNVKKRIIEIIISEIPSGL